MKHTIYTILMCICIISCKPQIDNFAVISGTIHAKGIDSVVLVNKATKYKKTIAVNNGAFSDSITINKVRRFGLKAGKKRYTLYLQKGYNLDITIDKDLTNRSISFSGVGAEVNSYYKDKNILLKKEGLHIKNEADLRALNLYSEADILTKTNKLRDSLSALLKNARLNDENFIAFEKENLFWDIAQRKYYLYRLMVNPANVNRDNTKTSTPSPGFYPQEFLNLKFDNEDLFINSPSYFSLASTNYLLAFFAKRAKKQGDVNEIIKILDSMCNTMSFTILKDDFLSSISVSTPLSDQKIAKTYFDYFTSKISDVNQKKEFVSYYKKIQEIRKAKENLIGKPSPKFIDYENFAGGTTSLDDLKGKYVYIDVWATWCAPCKREIPFLQKIEKKYHDKNIEFVSISVDKKAAQDAWKKMVKDKQLTGIQLLADKDFKSQFMQGFSVKSIPRFILIDPQGMIVNPDALRPSDPELVKLFDSLDM